MSTETTREKLIRWLGNLPSKPADAPYWTNGSFAKDCADAVDELAAAPEAPVVAGWLPTESQRHVMARAICLRGAEACNLDPEDFWKIYGVECIADVTAMLEAIGITAPTTQEPQA